MFKVEVDKSLATRRRLGRIVAIDLGSVVTREAGLPSVGFDPRGSEWSLGLSHIEGS